jgi:N utilization substance protein A
MFSKIPNVSAELAENLVAQGFFTFDDLSVIEPDQLAELGGLTEEQCEEIVAYADVEAARVEEEERKAIAEGRLKALEPVVETVVVAPESAAPSGNGAPKTDAGAETEAVAESETVTEEASEEGGLAVSADGVDEATDELHDEALAEEAAHSEAEGNGQEAPSLAATVLDELTEASGAIADEAADSAPEPPETELETGAHEATRSEESGAG